MTSPSGKGICSPKATAACARCGQDRRPRPGGRKGRSATRVTPPRCGCGGRCASCGQQRRLVAPPGPDPDTCADCAGLPLTHACADCGVEDKLYERGRCDRCSLRRRAAALRAGPDGRIPAGITPVSEAICAARNPKSALNWLRRGPGRSDVRRSGGREPARQPPGAGRPSPPPCRRLPAPDAHRRRRAAAPRRGTRPHRAVAYRRPRYGRA